MFHERLKKARKKAGFTQQQAADALKFSMRSYQRYEALNGRFEPSIETLVEMADLFDVSIDWLLCRDSWLSSHAISFDEY